MKEIGPEEGHVALAPPLDMPLFSFLNIVSVEFTELDKN